MLETVNQPSEPLTPTERAVYGEAGVADLRAFLDRWASEQLGSGIEHVRFRAGRIDVVWGVELQDGRAVVIKIHRSPELEARRTAIAAQRILNAHDFPCPVPLAGPLEVDGRVLTAETLIEGAIPDGREPAGRRLLAQGLQQHIAILSDQPELIAAAGTGPSWCHYQNGPWPIPHDTLVDFTSTPSGFDWVDDFGRRAADQILAHRDDTEVVAGHADWYAGNTAVVDGVIVGTFDWELVADTEPVIVGFAAACFAASSTGGGGLSGPEDIADFLRDYDSVRPVAFTERERRTARGAAAWIRAFNTRWQVALIEHGMADHDAIASVRENQAAYLPPA